jgi:hypothetical protein
MAERRVLSDRQERGGGPHEWHQLRVTSRVDVAEHPDQSPARHPSANRTAADAGRTHLVAADGAVLAALDPRDPTR